MQHSWSGKTCHLKHAFVHFHSFARVKQLSGGYNSDDDGHCDMFGFVFARSRIAKCPDTEFHISIAKRSVLAEKNKYQNKSVNVKVEASIFIWL